MNQETYNGLPFVVTIDRSHAHRRYQLNVVYPDYTIQPVNSPMCRDEFEKYYGFEVEHPHKILT